MNFNYTKRIESEWARTTRFKFWKARVPKILTETIKKRTRDAIIAATTGHLKIESEKNGIEKVRFQVLTEILFTTKIAFIRGRSCLPAWLCH